MKRLTWSILLCIVVPCLTLFLYDAYAEEVENTKRDSAQLCLDYIRKDLENPDSAKLVSFRWKDIKLLEGDNKDDEILNKKELHIVYEAIDSDGDEIEDEDFCVMNPKDENDIRFFEINTVIRKLKIENAKTQAKLDKTKKYGIGIVGASTYDESEYTEGTGFRVKYYNPTNKTIKYISTTIVGYNPVKDPIKDNKKKKTQITVKGVGPIGPKETATFNFDYTWFTDLVETFKIINIKVEYTDGSSKAVKPTKDVWINPELIDSKRVE